MARAYSDLRSRVIEAVLGDSSIRQAARRFGVGITTATRWVRRWREHGESSARRQGKPQGSCLDPYRGELLALVEQTRDTALAEIVVHLQAGHDLKVGTTTVWKFFERQGLAYTKLLGSIVMLRGNTPMKCKRNSGGRAIDHHSLQVMRQQAIKAVREGQTVQSVAAAFGVNIRSVFRWLSDFANGGQSALLTKPISGRPPKISVEEMHWLAQAVRDHSRQQYRVEFDLWTLSLSAVTRIMKRLGFTAQKPLYRCLAAGCGTGTPVGKRDLPGEAGLRSDYHAGTTWALQGETPLVEATGRRFSVNMLSAVGTRGVFRFMLHDGTVTASVFREFLKRLPIGAEQPVFVIVNGHLVHRGWRVRAFVEEQAGRLKLFHLPPYSATAEPGRAGQALCVQAGILCRTGKT